MKNIRPRIRIIEGFLQDLCLNIGERPTGSKNNRLAQEYLGRILQRQGYQVEYQEFDCIDWHWSSISLHLGDQSLPAFVAPYSQPCDIHAPFELIGSLEQLASADLADKIAVVYGDLTREPLLPKNFPFGKPAEHQRIIHLLEEKSPKAVITASKEENQQGPTPIIEDGDFDIPCAMLSNVGAQPLFARASQPLTLKIESSRKDVRAANVIARSVSPASSSSAKAGGRKKIVLSAHLDTKPGTPGALDNASGLATLLYVAELMQYKRDEFALELVCFNGEDHYSNAGEVAYLERYQSGFQNILFNINCDGLGYKQGKIGLAYHSCPAELVSICERLRQDYQLIRLIDPWPQGDHMIFVMHNVPAFSFTSVEAGSVPAKIIHTMLDTIDLLDAESILSTAMFIKQLIEAAFRYSSQPPST